MKARSCLLCGSKCDLFSFPKNDINRKKWADAVKIDLNSIKNNVDKICKHHFSVEQFRYKSGKRLKADAVPSLSSVKGENNGKNEETECMLTSNENEHHKNRKDMCLLCGYVSASGFYRFPKNILLKKQWAMFCEISTVNVKPYHRLCSKHFEVEYNLHKVPTLHPKLHCLAERNETLTNSSAVRPNIEDILPKCEYIIPESENIFECENFIPKCENVTPTHSDSLHSETIQPLIYFKRYGDITEEDVVCPRKAVLSLRMGKAEIDKCRRKLKQVQTENYKLKIKIESLNKRLAESEEKHLNIFLNV